MLVTITSNRKLSNSAYHRAGGTQSHRSHWWLRRADGEFLPLERVRGDASLDVEMDLEPGQYQIGTGSGKDAIRESHSLTIDGEWT